MYAFFNWNSKLDKQNEIFILWTLILEKQIKSVIMAISANKEYFSGLRFSSKVISL